MPTGDEIYMMALRLGRAGRRDDAIRWLEDHADDIVSHAAALGLMGTLLAMNERPKAALAHFEQSVALDGSRAVIHSDMGVALTKLNRADEALASFDRALALDPGDVQALNNRSHHWLELREGELALADAERALALRPRLMPAHRQRSRALLLLHRWDDALRSIDEALVLDPRNAENHAVRGEILDAAGRREEAVEAFDRAVDLQDVGENHAYGRGLGHLRHHAFAAGWADYEHRWRDANFVRTTWRHDRELLRRREAEPKDVAGRRVLLLGEQGVGDEIMFASMIPDLAAVAAKVVCVTNPRLRALFQASFPQVDFATDTRTMDLSAFDRIVPSGSLGALFRNAMEEFPGAPYLTPRPHAVARWMNRLGSRTTPLRVGLSWRGGVFSTGANGRSLDLSALAPLLERADCEFVSLQHGDVAAEIDAVNATLARPLRRFEPAELDEFESLAGLVRALDVIVSVQTALVHLAGAVGTPCLAMIPFFPEWRYGQGVSTMPWYGGVELFRQPRHGAWPPILAAIGAALDRRGRLTSN